ncbi:hypothetical protein C0033_00880 [Clostridium sp. chh4-2]|uniref:hypothetical protein n=1 Tax=Clostridium sp. chh4-2 TaxID=2067550 RepID=UPI000CCEF1F8|nr:hypothetical protein [Clostridium sp. chh4-2]PNV63917.1 hypothetical protein C0033_00880 [Clostridium sp. chh4-2]
MKIRYFILGGFISILLTGCGNSKDLQIQNESLAAQIKSLDAEKESINAEKESLVSLNESLSVELDSEKKRADSLQESINKIEEETVLQEGDISVVVTDKSSTVGKYSQLYCPLIFDVTNHTDKDIQGIEGILTIKDLFGKEIISSECDFTGQTLSVGQTVTIDSLRFSVNQFMDDHMKLYNTDYKDLKFEYTVTQIVFTDGTVKE